MNNTEDNKKGIDVQLEQFADVRILRFQVNGFENLNLKQKQLVYYLSQAAICGRDILYDQNGRYNLLIRKNLEAIFETYPGPKNTPEWEAFETYLKRIWFSNGIYHHYSNDKLSPGFSEAYFDQLVDDCKPDEITSWPGQSHDDTLKLLKRVIFDKTFQPKKVVQDANSDIVADSAVNFYGEGLSQEKAEFFYISMRKPDDNKPLSYGLNSKLLLENEKITEKTWKIGGMYSRALEEIVSWLEKAWTLAENESQKEQLELLINYYKTGDLKLWDQYNVLWLSDTQSHIDFVNGFIEVYSDPLGIKATWESIVNFKDLAATKRTEIISKNAQWFEDHSPVDERFRKKTVKGVSAKVITVAMLGGDCYPATPIGINLPNADWIRRDHGSKSVTIENITYAYAHADLSSGIAEEFLLTPEEIERKKKYGYLTDNLHTDLHECLGHGSGQMLPGVSSEALRNYHSPLEETRADLFALFYMMDPKMVELGLLPDLEAAKTQYYNYILNGLMLQLRRIEPGKSIEQAHMRNRQLIASWCYEKGMDEKVIELVIKNHKTFIRINDYLRLRSLFAELLREVQRIKSEGDYESGKKLVETFGVKVNKELHAEVLSRFKKLNIAPYSGFVNPEYELVTDGNRITDVKLKECSNYSGQMLNYSRNYSFLPVKN